MANRFLVLIGFALVGCAPQGWSFDFPLCMEYHTTWGNTEAEAQAQCEILQDGYEMYRAETPAECLATHDELRRLHDELKRCQIDAWPDVAASQDCTRVHNEQTFEIIEMGPSSCDWNRSD